jgi:iron complex transport system ATP-binding protein
MLQIQQLNYVTKSGKPILLNVNGIFPLHQFTAVIGANGAGKSTLFKCIANEIKYQSGNIHWLDKDVKHISNLTKSHSIAILRQHYQIALPFTAREIIEMATYQQTAQYTQSVKDKYIDEIAQYVGIENLLQANYLNLSGGEQQRVQLARVLLQLWISPSEEKLLLLDEPVSALDMQYQHQFMQLMHYLTHNKGFTIIAILHDINLASQYVDHVMLLHKGSVLAQGTPIDTLTAANLEQVYNIPFEVAIKDQHTIQIHIPKLNTLFNNINKN